MSAQLLLRQCVLTQRFEIREADGRSFLQLETPPPTGSVLTVVAEDESVRHFRVEHVVEVADDDQDIGCFGVFVDEQPLSTIGAENLAPDPQAVQAVLARDASLADGFDANAATESTAPTETAAADDSQSDATASEGPASEMAAMDGTVSDAPTDGAVEVAADGGEQPKKEKKKSKKRKGRKRG